MLIPWLVFLSFFSLYPSPPFAHLSPTSQLLCNNGNIVDGRASSVNTCSLFVSTKYWLPAPCRKCIIHLHAIVIYSSKNWPLKQFLNLFFFWQSPSLLIHKVYNCCRGICWAVGFSLDVYSIEFLPMALNSHKDRYMHVLLPLFFFRYIK